MINLKPNRIGSLRTNDFCFFQIVLFTFIIVLFSTPLFAQSVTLTGKVLDAHSKEPVPFANVYVKANPTDGNSADFDGVFELKIDYQPDIIEISALGYDNLTWKFDGKTVLEFELEPASINLNEVVVKGSRKEDPAYALFKKVVANKPINDHEKVHAYGVEVYNKLELDLVDISEKFKDMRINKPFSFVFDYVDSTTEEKPFLPLFIAETISDYYFMDDPQKEKEHIKATKIVGDFENESFSELLGITEQKFNIYDNWIPIVGKKFASPISNKGTNFYRYYLVDSNFIDNKWCYQIQYFPKHGGINAFTGDFWVHDSTYAIKHIRLQIMDETHLNYIEKLSIVQYFDHVGDTMWMPKKDFITISTSKITEPFTGGLMKKLNENAPGAQAKRTTTYRKYDFEQIAVEEKIESEIGVSKDAFKKDDEFWETNRHEELSKSETTAYFLIDTIKNLPIIDKWQDILYAVYEGYVLAGPVDIGNFYTFYSNNQIEGHSFKVGLRTSENLSKKYWLGGYLAYGTKDRRWKHGLNFLYMIKVSPRQTIAANYWNDYFTSPYLKQDFSFSEDGFLSSHIFRRNNILYKLLSIRSFDASYYKEWKQGLSFKFGFASRYTEPQFNFKYNTGKETPKTSYILSEASVTARFAYKEKFLNGDFSRTSLGSPWPIFSLKYSRGLKDVFGGDLDYHKLEFRLTEKFKWGMWGYTNFSLLAGKMWGRLPYLNMFIPQGNESFFMNMSGFNLINEFTFASDQFVMATFDHHFDGLILQLLPLFKKWRLRSVANFRMLYGDMTPQNRIANEFNLYENTTENDPVRIMTPNEEPYMEVSYGVENIFRLLRVDMVYKLNYHSDLAPNWGVRMNLHFKL
ncbi:MAG: DUF5686 and carboxypeptidase regulatory-like domain-containing protein [Bacteroidetes bacterium]|jgi:hypothetical protein|nr:DUF5686 and carboxypeptidase regulatory-like domain-containing protein [Bacteroidota bacterium]